MPPSGVWAAEGRDGGPRLDRRQPGGQPQRVSSAQPPDAYFLPAVAGKLRLLARPRRATTVDLLVNLTPTERLSGSNRSQDRNLSLLLPSLKVFAAVDWSGSPLRVSFLDLASRKVAFDQEKVEKLDWDSGKSCSGPKVQ